MDRVAVLVDAGYLFAAGSALLSGSGKQKRDIVTLDEPATLAAFRELAAEVSKRPLLRIYWYDGAQPRTGLTVQHMRLAYCNDLKLRLGVLNSAGEQKGVDSLIVTDLVELARNRAVSDVVLMSGDEDVRIGVVLAQSYGVRVHLVGVHPSRGTQSPHLMQEADTTIEWDAGMLRQLMSVKEKAPAPPAPHSTSGSMERCLTESRGASEILTVLKGLLETLDADSRRAVSRYMTENRNSLPRELDGKLLARARAQLGRELSPQEKRYARDRFRNEILAG